MPWWLVPTTADFGLLVSGATIVELFEEAARGMQRTVLSDEEAMRVAVLPRNTDVWRVPATPEDPERTLVRWLDELIYQTEGEGRWLVEVAISMDHEAVHATVEWVDADAVVRDVEIKATTRHGLLIDHLEVGSRSPGMGEAPEVEGPAFIAHVVFDI